MGIFGEANLTVDGHQLLHRATLQDSIANYSAALLLLLLIPLGVFCNCLVLWFNCRHAGTPSSLIYRYLALLDLSVCCVRSPHQVWVLLSAEQRNFYEHTAPGLALQLVSLVTLSSTMLTISTVSLLGVVRLLAIALPLWYRRAISRIKVAVTVYISGVTVIYTGVAVQYLMCADVYWITVTQWIVDLDHPFLRTFVNVTVPMVGLSLAILSSVLTVVLLVFQARDAAHDAKQARDAKQSRRGSVTVVLMNLGLVVWLAMLTATTEYLPTGYQEMLCYLRQGQYEVYYLYYCMGSFMPMLLAVYNSLVIVLRCSKMRAMAREWRERVCRVKGPAGGKLSEGNKTGSLRQVQTPM